MTTDGIPQVGIGADIHAFEPGRPHCVSLPPSHCFAGFGRLRRTPSGGPGQGARTWRAK
jgi:hypothetical protein